jgi:hypothetical protein
MTGCPQADVALKCVASFRRAVWNSDDLICDLPSWTILATGLRA